MRVYTAMAAIIRPVAMAPIAIPKMVVASLKSLIFAAITQITPIFTKMAVTSATVAALLNAMPIKVPACPNPRVTLAAKTVVAMPIYIVMVVITEDVDTALIVI